MSIIFMICNLIAMFFGLYLFQSVFWYALGMLVMLDIIGVWLFFTYVTAIKIHIETKEREDKYTTGD